MASGTGQLEQLEREACEAIARASSLQDLREVRARYLGRKGSLSALLRGIGELAPEARAEAGGELNRAAARVEAQASERQHALERAAAEDSLREHAVDATLPGLRPPRGHLHPVTLIEREMAEFFRGLGFSIEEGPEVESEWNNFDALRIAADHPSRDSQDTFFVEGGQRAAHAHVAGADPRDERPHAAVPLHRAGPRLPRTITTRPTRRCSTRSRASWWTSGSPSAT